MSNQPTRAQEIEHVIWTRIKTERLGERLQHDTTLQLVVRSLAEVLAEVEGNIVHQVKKLLTEGQRK